MGQPVSSRLLVSVASHSPVADAEKVNADRPAVSPGDFPADLHGLRRRFPEHWAHFLRAHFQSATHIAAFFDVDHRTARDWLSGRHGATAPVALFAIQRIPGALQELMGEAA